MSLLNSLKSFKILLAIFLMVGGTAIGANTGPTETNKDNDKEQLHKEQEEHDEPGSDANSKNDGAGTKDEASEEGVSIYNSSFNYFFYLIYKVKFADIFKLPNRNTEENRSSLPTININWLLKKIANPNI